MASQTKITITHDKESTVDLQNILLNYRFTIDSHINGIENLLNNIGGSTRNAIITTVVDDGNGVAASGTLTLSSVVATNACTVGGVTFTAVASGATGNQFNVGANDTATAVNLAAAINASVSAGVLSVVTATSAAAVVTVSAAVTGPIGNNVPLVGGTNITASGAKLTGGLIPTNPASSTYSMGL